MSNAKIRLVLFGGAGIMLLLSFGLAVSHYAELPEKIPTHFGFNGLPNGYGSKTKIIILPVISLVISALLLVVERMPISFHYPVEIANESKEWQKQNIKLLIQLMQFELTVLFLVLIRENILVAQGELRGLSFLPLLIVILLFATIGIMIYRSARYSA